MALHFRGLGKREEKLKRVAKKRGKSVIQMFRDWIDGIKEVK